MADGGIVAAGALYALWTYRQVRASRWRDRAVLLGTASVSSLSCL